MGRLTQSRHDKDHVATSVQLTFSRPRSDTVGQTRSSPSACHKSHPSQIHPNSVTPCPTALAPSGRQDSRGDSRVAEFGKESCRGRGKSSARPALRTGDGRDPLADASAGRRARGVERGQRRRRTAKGAPPVGDRKGRTRQSTLRPSRAPRADGRRILRRRVVAGRDRGAAADQGPPPSPTLAACSLFLPRQLDVRLLKAGI